LVLLSESAHADWEYAKWGMTPDQVVASSRGAASLNKGRPEEAVEDYEIGAVATYALRGTFERYGFRVTFYFRHRHLGLVKLNLQDASGNRCFALQSDLKRVFGPPRHTDDRLDFLEWEDRRNNVGIASFRYEADTYASQTCDISYEPLFGPYLSPGQRLGLTEGQYIGYRECSPSHLQKCEDTDELFFGLPGRKGNSINKTEFRDALRRFMGSAEYDEVAERLSGPGLTSHLAGGGRLLAGFTPHNATSKGAVVFDARGGILLISELDVDTSHPSCGGKLKVFARNSTPEKRLLKSVNDWAQIAVAGVYGCQSSQASPVSVQVLVAKSEETKWTPVR
jgi:hypothetical protein